MQWIMEVREQRCLPLVQQRECRLRCHVRCLHAGARTEWIGEIRVQHRLLLVAVGAPAGPWLILVRKPGYKPTLVCAPRGHITRQIGNPFSRPILYSTYGTGWRYIFFFFSALSWPQCPHSPLCCPMPPRKAKENAEANAGAPPPPLSLHITAGPCKGTVFSEKARSARLGAARGGFPPASRENGCFPGPLFPRPRAPVASLPGARPSHSTRLAGGAHPHRTREGEQHGLHKGPERLAEARGAVLDGPALGGLRPGQLQRHLGE
jgi:hypothetical protein